MLGRASNTPHGLMSRGCEMERRLGGCASLTATLGWAADPLTCSTACSQGLSLEGALGERLPPHGTLQQAQQWFPHPKPELSAAPPQPRSPRSAAAFPSTPTLPADCGAPVTY